MSLGREQVLEIQRRGMRDWIRMLGASAPGSSLEEGDGVTAALVPSVPRRSIANSVSYTDPDALFARHERLAGLYEAAGIEAWTVWVPDFELETAAELERRGHKLDGDPLAMALELERWQPRELGDLDWDVEGSGEVAGPLNDLAYGIEDDGFAAGLVAPPDFVRQYQARVDGEVACVLSTIEHGNEAPQQRRGSATPPVDLGFYFVATHPDHRGAGLASRLMAAALTDARERGLQTSSLQASKMGEPVYRRLGFESFFRLHMYERRRGT